VIASRFAAGLLERSEKAVFTSCIFMTKGDAHLLAATGEFSRRSHRHEHPPHVSLCPLYRREPWTALSPSTRPSVGTHPSAAPIKIR